MLQADMAGAMTGIAVDEWTFAMRRPDAGSAEVLGQLRRRFDSLRGPTRTLLFWLAGTIALCAFYMAVLAATFGRPSWAATDAVANAVPLSLLAFALQALLRAEVIHRRWSAQAMWHAGGALAFGTVWYATIAILMALFAGMRGHGFAIGGFYGSALAWQVVQGAACYAAVAAACYALHFRALAAARPNVVVASPMAHYLIRRGEALVPVAVDEIVSVTGAQDYVEVTTPAGTHLARIGIAEFAGRLDGDAFVRVHRSAIIHLRFLERVDPVGGGRLLAHMANGPAIPVSRAGAKELRRYLM